MATEVSNPFRIQVVDVSGLPAYIQTNVTAQPNRWFPVPNSDLNRNIATLQPYIDSGHYNANGTPRAFGRYDSRYGYSGGTYSKLLKTIMLFGNGGSLGISGNGWRGNDVVGWDLSREPGPSTKWETLLNPTSAKREWARSEAAGGSSYDSLSNDQTVPFDPDNYVGPFTVTGITKANPGVLTYSGSPPIDVAVTQYVVLNVSGMTELMNLSGNPLDAFYLVNHNAGAKTFELYTIFGAPIDTTAFGTFTSGTFMLTRSWGGIKFKSDFDLWDVYPNPSTLPNPRVGSAGSASPGAIARPGGKPNSAHMYNQNHFKDNKKRFYTMGQGNLQETDSGNSQFVNFWDWDDSPRAWVCGFESGGLGQIANCGPEISGPISGDAILDAPMMFECRVNGEHYRCTGRGGVRLWQFDADEVWHDLGEIGAVTGFTNAAVGNAMIDPVNKRIIHLNGSNGAAFPAQPWQGKEYAVGTGSVVATHAGFLTITGDAASIITGQPAGGAGSMSHGFFYSAMLTAKFGVPTFVWIQNDGEIYTIKRTGAGTISVDLYATLPALAGYNCASGAVKTRPTGYGEEIQLYNRCGEDTDYGVLWINPNAGDPIWLIHPE